MPKPVKALTLLYRASDNEFPVKKFHQKCDGIENTVTVVETEFGKIIGGYTPVKWESPQSWKYKEDASGESFLFSVSLNEKYPVTNKQYATCQSKDYGPTFGSGQCDLYLYDKCNANNSSQAYFPHSYNNGKYQNNQQSYTAFSGQTNGYQFKVKQYEVFKLVINIY